MSRIVGLYGSPRPCGHSAQLLDRALDAAEAQGAEVERLRLEGLSLFACRACEHCAAGGDCVQSPDDASRLLETIHSADALLVASPVYFFGLPAQLKTLVDRAQLFWWRGEQSRLSGRPQAERRPAYAIVTAGQERAGEFDGVLGSLGAFFFSLDFQPQTPLLVPGVDRATRRSEDSEFLRRAEEIGRAASAKVLETKAGLE